VRVCVYVCVVCVYVCVFCAHACIIMWHVQVQLNKNQKHPCTAVRWHTCLKGSRDVLIDGAPALPRWKLFTAFDQGYTTGRFTVKGAPPAVLTPPCSWHQSWLSYMLHMPGWSVNGKIPELGTPAQECFHQVMLCSSDGIFLAVLLPAAEGERVAHPPLS